MRDDALPTTGWSLGWLGTGTGGLAEGPHLIPLDVLQNWLVGAKLSRDRIAIAKVGKWIE
jgi:hypothetical protein